MQKVSLIWLEKGFENDLKIGFSNISSRGLGYHSNRYSFNKIIWLGPLKLFLSNILFPKFTWLSVKFSVSTTVNELLLCFQTEKNKKKKMLFLTLIKHVE